MCKIEKVGFSCKIDRKFAWIDAVALNGFKIVHKCKSATITMHICTNTGAFYLTF